MSRSALERLDLSQLSAWAPELAKTFVALSSDIALVIDRSGVIRAVEQGDSASIAPEAARWIGQPWIDTVSGDTRGKIERLLEEATRDGVARRREVNHTPQPGISVPVAYTAVRLGENGPVLAVGRDMRAIAAIQQRFIESQQDMERGYWHAREAESRQRLLSQVATDAVMSVDPETLSILAANPAASSLFSSAGEQLVGRHAVSGFATISRGAVTELLAAARSEGQSGAIRARLQGTATSPSVAATSIRAPDGMRLLVRMRMPDPVQQAGYGTPYANEADGPRHAVVVTDPIGRIMMTNPAFLGMFHLNGEADAKGRLLSEWLGSSGYPLSSLIEQVRHDGVVGSTQVAARSIGGFSRQVDMSASLLTDGDQECIGFTIEAANDTASSQRSGLDDMQIGLDALARQLGDRPLAALVEEAASLAERHFIALALRRADGDAVAAAALLRVDGKQLVSPPGQPSDLPAGSGTGNLTGSSNSSEEGVSA